MFEDIYNKKVLITGSSSGIGFEIAKSFVERNCKVVINGRNEKKLKNASKKIEDTLTVSGNTENPFGAKKIVTKTVKLLKGLDILICNVGSGSSVKPGLENYKHWKKSFEKNFFSATNVIEESKKHLVKSKGVIICISSICGLEYVEGAPTTYSVAKAALNSYVKMTSKVLGKQGVRINAIAPGNIMFKDSVWHKKIKKNKEKTKQFIKSNVPLNKLGNPKNVADVALFLSSDLSNFVTGSVWIVDGGQINRIT